MLVREVDAEKFRTFIVESSTQKGRLYVVLRGVSASLMWCNCPAGERGVESCKHRAAVVREVNNVKAQDRDAFCSLSCGVRVGQRGEMCRACKMDVEAQRTAQRTNQQ